MLIFTPESAAALANNGWDQITPFRFERLYHGGIRARLLATGYWTVRGPDKKLRASGLDKPREAWGAMDANEAAWRQPEYRAYWDCYHAAREAV
jgi:hypothetical protein